MPLLEWRETARADLLAIVDYICRNIPSPSLLSADYADFHRLLRFFIGENLRNLRIQNHRSQNYNTTRKVIQANRVPLHHNGD
ncbi:MAG: hypothetical protein LGR52_07460 [Candidatus Thiosymbion ectosymbiont of Robbea hypermnestra]|nr:hypothetical protein [Candidatus Thiosymbion ectosymbiont of Robbea hypermnestra]